MISIRVKKYGNLSKFPLTRACQRVKRLGYAGILMFLFDQNMIFWPNFRFQDSVYPVVKIFAWLSFKICKLWSFVVTMPPCNRQFNSRLNIRCNFLSNLHFPSDFSVCLYALVIKKFAKFRHTELLSWSRADTKSNNCLWITGQFNSWSRGHVSALTWGCFAFNRPIRYIKIQPNTIEFSTRLWGINLTNSVVISQSLVLGSIVLGWILIYRNWSICNC